MDSVEGAAPVAPFRIDTYTQSLNNSAAAIAAQCRANAGRDLPWVAEQPGHARTAIVVGGGPSLADNLDRLRAMDGDIYALNGAHDYLISHGIVPRALILLDSRAADAAFVKSPRDGVEYLVSHQCHPDVFDALDGHDVRLWANYIPEVDAPAIAVVGGATVGVKALPLLYVMGYRSFHLFGYDSSYRGDDNHAYSQPLNAGEDRIDVWSGGRKFSCAPWMAKQVTEFVEAAKLLTSLGCEIDVTGDGLLPCAAQLMAGAKPSMDMIYDFDKHPARYDFINWLVNAAMYRNSQGCGKLRIAFRNTPTDLYSLRHVEGRPTPDDVYRLAMYLNVIRPALSLLDGVEEGGDGGSELDFAHLPPVAVDMYERGQAVPMLRASQRAVEVVAERFGDRKPVVVVLREAEHWPGRNSNVEAWKRFARESGEDVVFMRDTAKARDSFDGFETFDASDLHRRMALFEYARAVTGVVNGPNTLMVYNPAIRFLQFEKIDPTYPCHQGDWHEKNAGRRLGEAYPWCPPWQRYVALPDTFPNIMTQWRLLQTM